MDFRCCTFFREYPSNISEFISIYFLNIQSKPKLSQITMSKLFICSARCWTFKLVLDVCRLFFLIGRNKYECLLTTFRLLEHNVTAAVNVKWMLSYPSENQSDISLKTQINLHNKKINWALILNVYTNGWIIINWLLPPNFFLFR